ncbi:mucin-17-like [Lytechinus variegatus]|uniref:mucin-17-like n=1 Tax=Lytechinus variegatus TaxID=7654 RepID=UPI001BB17BFE|nr:mucin-17-like [Lytechinus variegatus]
MGSYQRITVFIFLIGCLVGLSVGSKAGCRGDGVCSTQRSVTASRRSVAPITDIEYDTVTEVGTTFEVVTQVSSDYISSLNVTQTLSPTSKGETVATAQNVTQTVVFTSSRASRAADAVTAVYTEVETVVETGTSPLDGDGKEELTTPSELTTDRLPVSTISPSPASDNLVDTGTTYNDITTVMMEEMTSDSERPEHIIVSTPSEDSISPLETTPGFLTTVDQISSAPTSTPKRATTALLQTPQLPTTPEDLTTSILHTSLPYTTEKIMTTILHTSLPPTSPDGPTTSAPERGTKANLQTSIPLTTLESSTMVLLQTSLPSTTPESITTALPHSFQTSTSDGSTAAPLQTTIQPPTSESITTALPHTVPSTTPEGSTAAPLQTSIQPSTSGSTTVQTTLPPTTPEQSSTASLGSTGSLSTSRGTQTMDADHGDSDLNQISVSDLSLNEIENIVTLQFTQITVESWYEHYDLLFRGYMASMLDSVKSSSDIYYISPTPLNQDGILYVSFIARSSSERKRSTNPVVPLDDILGALDNMTALIANLGLPESQAPNITTELPSFIQINLPTSTTLPDEEDNETTEAPIIPEDDDKETTEGPTRKPPPEIGFLSNPGLFISLVVIATVSIIIIIVGLIYLLCDRKRGRSGEYITNHTPRNSDLELGFDNPVMAENDKNVSNGNHLSSIKGEMESDMIVPYDNFTQEELMNYEVEDTHL